MGEEASNLDKANQVAYALEKDYEVVQRTDLPIEVRRAALQHLRESLIPIATSYIELLALDLDDEIWQ